MELQAAREASDKTQAQIAKETKMTVQQYQNYEYGKRKPSAETALKLAEALNIKSLKKFKAIFGAATPEIQKQPDGNPALEK